MSNKIYGPNDKIISIPGKNNPFREDMSPGMIKIIDKDSLTGLNIVNKVYFAYLDTRDQFITLGNFLRYIRENYKAIPAVFDFYTEARSEGLNHDDIKELLGQSIASVYGSAYHGEALAALDTYRDALEVNYQELKLYYESHSSI